jgi:hypothetical protein
MNAETGKPTYSSGHALKDGAAQTAMPVHSRDTTQLNNLCERPL